MVMIRRCLKKGENRYLRLSSQKWQLSSENSKIIYWREMYSLVTTKSIESCFNLVESELWSDFGQSLVKLFILILTSQLAEQFKSDHETFLICILRRAFQYTYGKKIEWLTLIELNLFTSVMTCSTNKLNLNLKSTSEHRSNVIFNVPQFLKKQLFW